MSGKKRWVWVAVMCVGLAARADYVEMSGTTGSMITGTTWEGGEVPFGSSTGLVTSAAVNVWTGNVWNNVAVRQTGGRIYAAGDGNFAMRGGLSDSGVTTIYEIEDSRTDYGSYTNLAVSGTLTFWSQYGENIQMNLLSGHVAVGQFSMNAAVKGTLNIRDGVFHANEFNASGGQINMLADGSADLFLGEMKSGMNVLFNFETGNSGSVTITKASNGNDWGFPNWDWMMKNNRLMVDGEFVDSLVDFVLSNDNKTIALDPEREYVKMAGTSGSIVTGSTWAGGEVPFGSSTGLVTSAAVNVWTGTAWYDVAVRQTGGHVYAAGDGNFAMRGGLSGSGVTTIYEIEDSRTDFGTYTNLVVSGTFSFWSQYGENMQMNLLSGHVQANLFSMNAAGKGTLNIRDGIFHANTFSAQGGRINLLAGGAAEVFLGEMVSSPHVVFNFETGSSATVTITKTQAGVDWGYAQWNWMVQNNRLLIDGTPAWTMHLFDLSEDGQTLSLNADPGPLPIEMAISRPEVDTLVLSWVAEAGGTYTLQTTTDLVAGEWEDTVPGIAGINGTLSVTNAMDQANLFYRIKATYE